MRAHEVKNSVQDVNQTRRPHVQPTQHDLVVLETATAMRHILEPVFVVDNLESRAERLGLSRKNATPGYQSSTLL